MITGLGTILFASIVTLWVRSYRTADSFHWCDTHRDHTIALSGGRFFYLTADWPNPRETLSLRHSSSPRTSVMPWWDDVERFNMPTRRWLLLRHVQNLYPYPPSQFVLSFFMPTWDVWWIPVWPLAILAAIIPAVGIVRWWRKLRRQQRGLCRECGYDLRETRDRCPECGTKPIGERGAEVVAVAHGGDRV